MVRAACVIGAVTGAPFGAIVGSIRDHHDPHAAFYGLVVPTVGGGLGALLGRVAASRGNASTIGHAILMMFVAAFLSGVAVDVVIFVLGVRHAGEFTFMASLAAVMFSPLLLFLGIVVGAVLNVIRHRLRARLQPRSAVTPDVLDRFG